MSTQNAEGAGLVTMADLFRPQEARTVAGKPQLHAETLKEALLKNAPGENMRGFLG